MFISSCGFVYQKSDPPFAGRRFLGGYRYRAVAIFAGISRTQPIRMTMAATPKRNKTLNDPSSAIANIEAQAKQAHAACAIGFD
jgi:hypothetical protein